MLKLRSLGVPLAHVINDLCSEYDKTPQALYKDWKQRGRWQDVLLDIGDFKQFGKDCYATHKEIFRKVVLESIQADNSNARVACFKLLRRINLDFLVLFPLITSTQRVEAKKGVELNELLKDYEETLNHINQMEGLHATH